MHVLHINFKYLLSVIKIAEIDNRRQVWHAVMLFSLHLRYFCTVAVGRVNFIRVVNVFVKPERAKC